MKLDLLVLAQEGAAPAAPSPIQQFLPLILIIIVFYFVLIRPQRKRQKELENKIASLKTGDTVVTAGGIHGRVANIKERTVVLKVADNTKIEFEKTSVQNVTKKKEQSGSQPESEDSSEDNNAS